MRVPESVPMSEDDAAEEDDWFEQAVGEDSAEADPFEAVGTDVDESGTDTEDVGTDTDDSGTEMGDAGTDVPDAGSAFEDAAFDAEPGGGGDEEGGMFDEGFASAFGGGDGESEFADEPLETDIPRLDLGIKGLDEMIQGGVPQRHLITTIGSAGTGKTTFGLQFLNHGLQVGDDGVFITLEQSHQSILDTANEWGWDFETAEAEENLAIVDLDPVEMANSLDNIRGELPELIEDFGADRLVLDSVSLLEMMYEDQARRRTEVYDFTRALKRAGVTTFLTSEASETNPYASRFGIIEYLTDAVFVLQYVRGESRETRLAVEIVKIRNANHSREMKPYEITSDGISVYQQANIF